MSHTLHFPRATLSTNDATTQTLLSFTVPSGKSGQWQVVAWGMRTDTYAGILKVFRGIFRNDSGTASEDTSDDNNSIGTPQNGTFDIDASGTDVRVRVTGKAGTDFNWVGVARFLSEEG